MLKGLNVLPEKLSNVTETRLESWRGGALSDSMCHAAHLVERTPDVNGAVLDDLVHHLRDGLGEVRVGELGCG